VVAISDTTPTVLKHQVFIINTWC